jgi:2-oxoglutarate ferredoxin oxidoreductase subunit alpha
MEPGLKEIFSKFRKVMTIEINYSDEPGAPMVNEDNRRYAQLATLLRSQTLMDIDCWSKVPGHPLQPGMIGKVIDSRLAEIEGAEKCSA